MSTLATMKARIADDLSRSDLTSQIATAINDAVTHYQKQRFWFNESRAITFATVAGTSDYTVLTGDVTSLGDLYAIDYVKIVIAASNIDDIDYVLPSRMEYLLNATTSQNQPYLYTTYNKTIRLYPIPSAAWTVRIGAHIKKAAPATDSEASNVWMTDAESLIRARAKYELAVHILKDPDMAVAMTAAVTEALDELKGTTNKMLGTGTIAPMCF